MAALDFPASPVTGQIFVGTSNTWQYDGSRWVILPPSPSPLLLSVKSEALQNPSTYMDTYAEFNFSDDTKYPFATASEITIAGIFMKPDRAVTCYGHIYTYNVMDLFNLASGRNMAYTNSVASGGANWTMLGFITATVPVPANTANSWYFRLVGVAGGATAYGYAFTYTRKRFRVS